MSNDDTPSGTASKGTLVMTSTPIDFSAVPKRANPRERCEVFAAAKAAGWTLGDALDAAKAAGWLKAEMFVAARAAKWWASEVVAATLDRWNLEDVFIGAAVDGWTVGDVLGMAYTARYPIGGIVGKIRLHGGSCATNIVELLWRAGWSLHQVMIALEDGFWSRGEVLAGAWDAGYEVVVVFTAARRAGWLISDVLAPPRPRSSKDYRLDDLYPGRGRARHIAAAMAAGWTRAEVIRAAEAAGWSLAETTAAA